MRLGIDVSTYDELCALSPHYFYEGEEIEPIRFLRDHNGVDAIRLRLWVDPHDEQGNPYGAGSNDLPCFLRMAKKFVGMGFAILLDFHYGDFWVDPAKQPCPKAWKGLPYEEVVKKLREYTLDTLLTIKKEGIPLYAIQIGNEITHGMVWPYGSLYAHEFSPDLGGDFEGLCGLLKAGTEAAREVYPESKLILHLEHSASNDVQAPWLREVIGRGVDFDVIGQSYYPFWHGSLEGFAENNRLLQEEFHRPIWVVECGYCFAASPYEKAEGLINLIDEDFVKQHSEQYVPYPLTPQGQADYLKAFLKTAKEVGVEEVYYWEPLWIKVKGAAWASEAGRTYSGDESKPLFNEWANETLFDFDGHANPGLDAFSKKTVDSL